MKKVLSVIILAGMIAPMVALAQPKTSCELAHDITGIDAACTSAATVDETATKAWGMCCILDAVYTVIDWIFFVMIAVVGFLVIWGGFTIATAGGAPEKLGQGRSYILFAMVGLAIALLSKAVPSLVEALIGV